MLKRIFSSLAFDGTFLAISELSQAALASGATPADVIGRKMWDFNSPTEAERIQKHFAHCILHGGEVEYRTASVIGGVTEHWQVKLTRTAGPAHVLCVGMLVLPDAPTLSEKEHELLQLLAADLTYDQIGDRLLVTRDKLHHRLSALRSKFGVATMHGLMAAAARFEMLGD